MQKKNTKQSVKLKSYQKKKKNLDIRNKTQMKNQHSSFNVTVVKYLIQSNNTSEMRYTM